MYDIYSNAQDDKWRFTLGRSGARNLLTIGLNPSTATSEKADTTMSKVEVVARQNGFDGFVMLNLYPVRTTDYNELPLNVDVEAYSENIKRIRALVSAEPSPVIWAAWGESIRTRPYFVSAAMELLSKLPNKTKWQHFGSLTTTGHPRHPSRISYEWSFIELDAQRYAKTLGT